MNIKQIINGQKGDKLFLLGNESTVRGALEAGVSVAATYPGTPSSEIGDVFSKIAKDAGVYFEFSINEKVALEVAAAASASGLRSLTFMKHVGLNVASDSFMSTVYTGVRGGMIILSADDPSMFSSQNEQDNRHYARIANIPSIEPSNPQEIKEFMKYGYEISEKFQIPVLLRTTTRVSHMRGIVELNDIPEQENNGFFQKDPQQFVPVPATARIMHKELVEKMEKLLSIANNSPLNQIYYQNEEIQKDDLLELASNSKIGVISSGSAFNYVCDVVNEHEWDLPILKLGFTYPFPEDLVLNFLKDLDKVIIVEEVDPIMEKELFAVLGKNKIQMGVHGKLDGTLPLIYEFNQDIVEESFKNVLNGVTKIHDSGEAPTLVESSALKLPNRPPTLCPGCPHRAIYYSIKNARKELGIDFKDLIFPTDIGCYTLGIESPYNAADYLLAMGSSIGTSCGFSRATDQYIICFIGDSTFFHSGIPPLINAVHNKHKLVVTVLDNRTTAMTGGQPNPGLPVDGMGDTAPEISIEKIVRATGAEFVETINPLSLKKTVDVYKRALEYDGVSVVISKYPCVLIKDKKPSKAVMDVKDEKCEGCMECASELACPAISLNNEGKIEIDPLACKGCTICVQMCSKKAIRARK
ncbi:indolepyruvate ferredoxin oxidoreductase subunit alpha [Methanobacterium alcaliphilum]|uniref:indolepyruvate ferredoxin oxidoreductase subunit alpha n=1 Tax=Methanobacterium alcaliphilum TaxID=392018 RepID=UPI00200AF816|nr:indolepyruvate ferredoxin oxidoreductase subunit alpha [Methanobacterium alcaliphilum]MCK9151240.1 indolepyruvate ferredoxin oxidoreductase subunit alpha [Methanobacterium alcaliphilum]